MIITAPSVKTEASLMSADGGAGDDEDDILKVEGGLQLNYLPQQGGTVVDDADADDDR